MTSRELNHAEYRALLEPGVVRADDTAEMLVNLWPYVEPVLLSRFPDHREWEGDVAYIYETTEGRYQHIGVTAPENNTYVVVVADITTREIVGHHVLNLHKLYGLDEP